MKKNCMHISADYDNYTDGWSWVVFTGDSPRPKKGDDLTKEDCMTLENFCRHLSAFTSIAIQNANTKLVEKDNTLKDEIDKMVDEK